MSRGTDVRTMGSTEERRDDGRFVYRGTLGTDRVILDPQFKYIINVGSVGQPRDGLNHDAKYIIWDDEARILEVMFVPYDARSTAAKILNLGWPEYLAKRLYQ